MEDEVDDKFIIIQFNYFLQMRNKQLKVYTVGKKKETKGYKTLICNGG